MSPLANLTQLELLSLGGNSIENFEPVNNLPNLSQCLGCQISAQDL